MSNYMEELIQQEMYKTLYPAKKIKNMREKAIDFLRKKKILSDGQTLWPVFDEKMNSVDVIDLFVKFAQTIQGGLNWVPVAEEKPENLQWVLVSSNKVIPIFSIAQYTDGYGLKSCSDDFGEYHEDSDAYYCPEGFYQYSSDGEILSQMEDDEVTHFIPLQFIPMP